MPPTDDVQLKGGAPGWLAHVASALMMRSSPAVHGATAGLLVHMRCMCTQAPFATVCRIRRTRFQSTCMLRQLSRAHVRDIVWWRGKTLIQHVHAPRDVRIACCCGLGRLALTGGSSLWLGFSPEAHPFRACCMVCTPTRHRHAARYACVPCT